MLILKYIRFEVFTAVTMKMSSSGMWRSVDLALTDVSEERIASIFREEKSASGEPA
jgi:putative lipoic acid-binding regulatory protein